MRISEKEREVYGDLILFSLSPGKPLRCVEDNKAFNNNKRENLIDILLIADDGFH